MLVGTRPMESPAGALRTAGDPADLAGPAVPSGDRSAGATYPVCALAGAVASTFHGGTMLGARGYLPRARCDPAPPWAITAAIARKTLPAGVLTDDRITVAAVVAHFGYGAAAGALYRPLAGHADEHPLLRGTTYGLAVWAVSYLGWIPALRLLPPATRRPAQQNVMMLLAHGTWGLALGGTLAWARRAR